MVTEVDLGKAGLFFNFNFFTCTVLEKDLFFFPDLQIVCSIWSGMPTVQFHSEPTTESTSDARSQVKRLTVLLTNN